MKRTKLKVFIVLVVLAVFTLSLVSTGYADGQKKMLEAWYGLSNLRYNGQDLTQQMEPFAVNQTTYLPLRKMAELLNLDITWDQTTHTVLLSDKPGQSVSELKALVAIKDAEIQRLNSEVTSLKNQLAAADDEEMDLDDLEEVLNDDYNEYEDIEFEITLSGDEDEIVVKVEVDLDDYDDEWSDLTSIDKIDYLQDLVDEILDVDEYEDADITGYIRDSSSSSTSKLFSFYVNSSSDVKQGTGSSSSSDEDDLEDEIYDEYVSDFNDDNDFDFDVTVLDADEDDVKLRLDIDLEDYEDEYDDLLDDGDIKSLMEDIYDYILDMDDYEDAEVIVYVYDTDTSDFVAMYDEDGFDDTP